MNKYYPRVKHQVVFKHTPLRDYLLVGKSALEVDGSVKEVLQQCDGCHTVEEIVGWAAQREGEPVEAVREEVEQFLNTLYEEGVITYRESPDYLPPIYAYDRPLSVVWEITYACNQKCRYCISRAGNPHPDELSLEEIDTVLDELIELQVGLINITGGDTMLRKDAALHIGRRASQNGIDLQLLTNGMLLTPEVAQEIYEAGIQYVQVSLDSARPDVNDWQRGIKGAWGKTVEGIKNLRNAGVRVKAAAVVTSETLKYYRETEAFLKTIADTVALGRVVPLGRGTNNSCLLTPEMHYKLLELGCTIEGNLADFILCKEGCSIGTTPVIAPNGDVYPCMFTKYEELKLGNVRETSIQSIYENSAILSELFKCTVDKIEPCRTCWNRYYCGGGCRGCAFAYHGTIYKSDLYQCAARKKLAKELLKRGHPSTRKALQELISLARSG